MPPPARDLRQFAAPLAGGLLAFALYAATLPPGLTWAHAGADGGDLLAAALTGGVPHPSGYPAHQLLLRFAIALLGSAPAQAGAWLSAACAALAVGLLVDLAQRSVRREEAGHRAAGSFAALVAGLAWAASPGLWGQAVIVEVYALNGLICVGLLWLAWRWAEVRAAGAATWPWMVAGGFVFGLGAANHLTVALMLPGLAAWGWLTARAAASRFPRRDLGLAGLAALVAFAAYLYLPLAASRRPPVNWGDASTLGGFVWVVTGRPYAGLAFGLPVDALPARLLGWATWTARQFLPWGLLLALAGLWRLDRTCKSWWVTTLLVWLAFTAYAIGYNTTDSLTYLIPAFAVMALWMAEALYVAFAWEPGRRWLQTGVVVLAIGLLPAASVACGWQAQDLSADRTAEDFLDAALAEAEPGAVIFTAGDERTFALWYAVYGLRRRPDLAVINVNLYAYEWYRRALAETHPNLLPSGEDAPLIEPLIAVLARSRPVYAAEDLGLDLGALEEERQGPLTRWRNRAP